MTSETVAARLRPRLADMRRMREIMVTKEDLADFATKLSAETDLAELRRRVDALAEGTVAHDGKLDVAIARLDGLRVLWQVILGAVALLIWVLIAIFGFLLTT